MRMSVFGFAVAAALLFSASAYAQAPLVEAFGGVPALGDAAISADGTRVVTAASRDGRPAIVVYDVDQGQPIYAASPDQNNELRSVGWADDNIISFRSTRTFRPGEVLPENFRFQGGPRRITFARDSVIDITTGRMRALVTGGETAWADQGSYLVAPIEGDSGFGRMVGRAPIIEAQRRVVYRVNLTNGETRQALVRAGEDTIHYLFDARGDVIARTDSDEQTNRWRIFVYDANGQDRLLLEGENATGSPIHIVGALADGRLAAMDEDADDQFYVMYAIDRITGAREVVFSRPGYELSEAIIDPWSRQVVGAEWTETEGLQHFFDPALQAAYQGLGQHFPNGGAKIMSWSRDRGRLLILAENGLDGGAYYILTTAANALRRLGFRYPAIAASPAGTRQSITFRARDGVRVPAYLTLPLGIEPRNMPLVVLVHGGPSGRDDMNFDYWSTFLASRGYAVLQSNFRGSSGYGSAWERAGHGEWGGLMQTDVEDGAAALVRSGMADASRMCIVGASYGGYAALAGAALTPERYRCAVSVAGVSDLNEFIRQRQREAGAQSATADYWRISIGDREEDAQRLRERSPANLADRVRIPILLMHGSDDTVVPILQSRRMEARLRDAGKEVRFVELRGDDHWLSDAATRIQMLRELEAFLAQHLGAPAVAQ
ncbi:MAG: prolyl oligopeptidase family serine peptidase [Terricaulis sp.]